MDLETRSLYQTKLQAEARRANAEALREERQAELFAIHLDRERADDAEKAAQNPQHNVFHLMGEVNGQTAFQSMRLLEKYVRLRPELPVEMLITSAGGEIVQGLAIYDRIMTLRRKGGNINTLALGMAGSISGLLLQAGEVRAMGAEAWLLIHKASIAGASGTTDDIQATVGWIDKIEERLVDIFVIRARIPRKTFLAKWRATAGKAWWVSADEALKLGFIDEVR